VINSRTTIASRVTASSRSHTGNIFVKRKGSSPPYTINAGGGASSFTTVKTKKERFHLQISYLNREKTSKLKLQIN